MNAWPGEHDALRQQLQAHRQELLDKIAELGAANPTEVAALGFGKRIGDATSYAVERMTGAFQARTLYETVKELEHALERLEGGRYGLCVTCGLPIPPERLEALPWAAQCVPCGARQPGRG